MDLLVPYQNAYNIFHSSGLWARQYHKPMPELHQELATQPLEDMPREPNIFKSFFSKLVLLKDEPPYPHISEERRIKGGII